ncbi:MAG: alpha/beta hydrolase [Bacteroidota bacterium]
MPQSNKPQQTKRPSLFWLATEIGRAVTELGISAPYRKFFHKKEKGDGHPVLVLPGFMASDNSTKLLRNFIDDLGYQSYGWDMGRNTAKVQSLYVLMDKLEKIHESHGREVTLIGWSLGGVYARQIAKEKPEMVRQVITLGSPFRGITAPNYATWLYNLISDGKRVVDLDPELLADLPKPTPVPTTSIYSKQDGVVPWEVCMEAYESEIAQNIQVRGSHLGMGVNATILNIIADRLKYEKWNWTHFQSNGVVHDLLFYPSF